MIIGSVHNSSEYNQLHPLFPRAFEYLNSIDLKNPQFGKIEIDGDNLFILVSESTLKSQEKTILEVHDQYIDIQLPLSKPERFGWTSRDNLRIESTSFNLEKDIQFFKDKPSTYFDIQPGCFVIFFPNDGHAPCIGEGSIIKIVMKIKVN